MAKLSIVAGATSQSVNIKIYVLSTGAAQTGLVYNSSGLTCYYTFTGANATATAVTLATLAAVNSAYSSGGFKEIGAGQPGVYRFDIPNAAITTGKGRSVNFTFTGFSGMADCDLEIELTGIDNQDSVRGGMTALPNAAAGAVGGLPLSVDTSGRVDVLKINGTSQTARDLGASVLLSVGTGTGQVNLSAGKVPATVAAADVSGNPAVNAAQIGGSAPASATVGTVTNLTNAPSSGDFTATMKTSLNAATPTSVQNIAAQTGDSYARIGAAGAGLTALGDTRIANLDAAVSTRLAPSGTLATVTNLTNSPTAGDLTATMKSSVSTAAWATPLPGAFGSGTAGLLLANAGGGSSPTTIADAVLTRDMSAVTGAPSRCLLNAIRALRNRTVLVDNGDGTGTITVYAEDGVTVAWTETATFDPTAKPVTGVNPA